MKAVLDQLNASKGTEEYHVGEIFLSATPRTTRRRSDNARQDPRRSCAAAHRSPAMPANIRKRRPRRSAATSAGFAPSSSRAHWPSALRQMPAGAISNPIPVPGGFSIIAVQDTRKILTADPRDAVLSLKQISITFPKGTTPRSRPSRSFRGLPTRRQHVGGCGGAEKIAADFHGEVVTSDQVKMRDLPPALQRLMLPMQVGQATQPFGSLEEGVRVLVICGRDEVEPGGADATTTSISQLNEERVNSRARPLSARSSPRRGDRIPLIGHFG